MQKRSVWTDRALFRQLYSNLLHLFWAAALVDALYIFAHVSLILFCPSAAMARGMYLSAVLPMIEHILMSVLLLTACGMLEESIFRSI